MSQPPRKYSVCIPRPYTTRGGEQKTHFWHVGTGFSLRERSGVTVKLFSKMLLTDQFVLFEDEPEDTPAGSAAPPPDDDIPF